MLVTALLEFEAAAPERAALVADGATWTARDLLALADGFGPAVRRTGAIRVGAAMRESAELVALMVAAAREGVDLALLDPDMGPDLLLSHMASVGVDSVILAAGHDALISGLPRDRRSVLSRSAPEDPRALDPGRERESVVTLLTSGTSGEPRPVSHRWTSLCAGLDRRSNAAGERWLLAYRLKHFGGIQVLLHTLLNHHTLVIADSHQVAALWAAAVRERVTHISSTPTFWRMAAGIAESPLRTLRHITLSGEVMTDGVLRLLRRHYPSASIAQVYATTELGSIVSVTDGRTGLPAHLFEDAPDRPAMFCIADSELWARPAGRPDRSWVPTGDLVDRQGDRVHFLGRKSELINVGGVKVHPQVVEAVVDGIEGIALARAAADPNPITGQMVRLDVVLRSGARPDDVERRIREACRHLGRHAMPARIRYVEALSTNNFKVRRHA